ncbi:MAG TPA: hypothetical protein VD769_11695 [Gaiellaceae bacterium]|nr:hypothetical protein [Gaiellaceae bacterium]
MRRTLVLLTIAALATGAAEAAFGAVPVLLRTPGAELVELRGGNGRAVVARRGSLNITVRSGRVRIVDLPAAGSPNLSDQCRRRARRVRPNAVEIVGTDIRCLIWSGQGGGAWQVILRGRGISASGVVRGSLTLDAMNRGFPGRYRVADGDWQRWPRRVKTIPLDRR